ncbi:methyltransferase domain-containing protein [Sphingomonas sp.]|uniref:methyltransferase domain-containing protein n=1 Tax=Sphingomonas sp. TaxID=28214 RepID=UPI002D0E0ADC|nr:50S ribosomal protein L11 methyltransferase [Sphingomonas sp.]HWK36403.1 50S ribosomal protein L11 methyltransferase [Sphingomonas sp.]
MNEETTIRADTPADFDQMVQRAGDDPRELTTLSRLARTMGREGDAYPIARRARALAPHDPEIAILTHEPFAAAVPSWHFRIIADHRRNTAYDAAIRRAVTPGCTVLDIGSGTGLLAMMAARAGAGHVYSCEMNPAVAEAARAIVAANGLADRVTVIAKKSTDLDLAVDLGGAPVDVLVSEIISNDLLAEAALPVMNDAVRRLLKPGGRMVPESGQILVALADLPLPEREFLYDVAGFDVSLFHALAERPQLVKTDDPDLRLRSPAKELFHFDFTTGGPWGPLRAWTDCIADGGRVSGVVQWMRFQLDAETVYETRPGPGPSSSWATLFYPFDCPVRPPAGSALRIEGVHDEQNVLLWADEASFR